MPDVSRLAHDCIGLVGQPGMVTTREFIAMALWHLLDGLRSSPTLPRTKAPEDHPNV